LRRESEYLDAGALGRREERVLVNSEYVKQFSLLDVNTAFADNGLDEMGLVHFCIKKRQKKTTCKTGVSG
jgi:hypothetical protein